MPAQVLGGRVDDDVGAPLDRADQVGGGDRVVDDEGHADLVGDRCDRLDVEDVALRVGDGLAVEGDRLVIGERAPGLGIEGVRDEAGLDAQASQRVLQQGDAAAVQGGGGDHVVAGDGQGEDRQGGRGLAGGYEEAADAALEGRDACGDAVGRRVGQARVDGAQLLQGEAVRSLRGVFKGVGGGLVNGQRGGTGGRVNVVSGVNLLGFEGPVVGGHCAAPVVKGGWCLWFPCGGPLRRCYEHASRRVPLSGDCAAVACADAQSAAHSTVHASNCLSSTRPGRGGPGWWTFVTGRVWRRGCEQAHSDG